MEMNLISGGGKCDRCDRVAVAHMTSIVDGVTHEAHLCEEHASADAAAGGVKLDFDAMHRMLAPKTRAMAAIMRAHGRRPTTAEMMEIQGIRPADVPAEFGADLWARIAEEAAAPAAAFDPDVARQGEEMGRVADFMEAHGRMPGAGELPEA